MSSVLSPTCEESLQSQQRGTGVDPDFCQQNVTDLENTANRMQ